MSQKALATTVARGDIGLMQCGTTNFFIQSVSCQLGHTDSETKFQSSSLHSGKQPLATVVAKAHCHTIEHVMKM